MTDKQRKAIAEHGEKLMAIFPDATERDPVKLCRKLRALEVKAGAVALRLCNGPEYPGEHDADKILDGVLGKVNKLLGNYQLGAKMTVRVPVFINRDPRGYALKIRDDYMRSVGDNLPLQRDMGGYGIIAPEINA